MPILIQNARILTPFSQQDGDVLVSGDRIVDVSRAINPPRGTTVIDGSNCYLAPGFIDMHVHGGYGVEVMQSDAQAVAQLANACAADGTTTIVPTVTSARIADLEKAIDTVKAAQEIPADATIAGVHVQGPFLSAVHAEGDRAQAPTPEAANWQALYSRWEGIRMVGLSPEIQGVTAIGDFLRKRGIIASIAYSDAGYDQIMTAIGHGFSDVTNVYVNTSSLKKKEDMHVPGVTECALAMDELSLQVAPDVKRLPLLLLQIIAKCKAAENILLVTDAAHPGRENGTDKQDETTMAQMVQNMVASGVSLRVALRMATVNPARRLGLENSKGRIGVGYDADIVLLDEQLNVRFSMASGTILRHDLPNRE